MFFTQVFVLPLKYRCVYFSHLWSTGVLGRYQNTIWAQYLPFFVFPTNECHLASALPHWHSGHLTMHLFPRLLWGFTLKHTKSPEPHCCKHYLAGQSGKIPHTEEEGSWEATAGCQSAGGWAEEGKTSWHKPESMEERVTLPLRVVLKLKTEETLLTFSGLRRTTLIRTKSTLQQLTVNTECLARGMTVTSQS